MDALLLFLKVGEGVNEKDFVFFVRFRINIIYGVEEFYMHSLRNYMEELVYEVIDDIADDMKICRCERCRLDIAAKALNDLPPLYIITQKGQVYSRINNLKAQFEVDIIAAVSKAAILVKRNPKHDGNEEDE